eukprot:1504319-Lingulodinium_polyedra.AAC.1
MAQPSCMSRSTSYSSRNDQRTFVRQVFAEAPFGMRQSFSERHSPNALIRPYIFRATTSSAGEFTTP